MARCRFATPPPRLPHWFDNDREADSHILAWLSWDRLLECPPATVQWKSSNNLYQDNVWRQDNSHLECKQRQETATGKGCGYCSERHHTALSQFYILIERFRASRKRNMAIRFASPGTAFVEFGKHRTIWRGLGLVEREYGIEYFSKQFPVFTCQFWARKKTMVSFCKHIWYMRSRQTVNSPIY